MSDAETNAQQEAQTSTMEVSEFASLLDKEFKPKSDRAKEAVEEAVKTLAQTALEGVATVSDDVFQTIQSMIAAIDQKLSEQINAIVHHPDYPAARRRLAGPPLLGEQHRDRRDAEDPRHEHLQEGVGQDAEEVQGNGLGSEPDLQAGLRGGIRPVRRRALWLPGRRLPFRPQSSRCGNVGRDRQGLRRVARSVHHADCRPRRCKWTPGKSWPTRAT